MNCTVEKLGKLVFVNLNVSRIIYIGMLYFGLFLFE